MKLYARDLAISTLFIIEIITLVSNINNLYGDIFYAFVNFFSLTIISLFKDS